MNESMNRRKRKSRGAGVGGWTSEEEGEREEGVSGTPSTYPA